MASRQVLWQQGQPVACAAVASKRHTARTAGGHPGRGGQGTAPLLARQATFWALRCTVSGGAFRKGHGTRSREPTISSKRGRETRGRNPQTALGAHSQHNSTTARPGWWDLSVQGIEGRRGSLRFPFICCLIAAAGGWIRRVFPGTSLETQWLRLCAPSEEGTDIIPGWETKVLHATRCSQKEKKTRQVFPPGARSTEGEGQGSTLSPAALDSLFPVGSHCWDCGHKEFWGRRQP